MKDEAVHVEFEFRIVDGILEVSWVSRVREARNSAFNGQGRQCEAGECRAPVRRVGTSEGVCANVACTRVNPDSRGGRSIVFVALEVSRDPGWKRCSIQEKVRGRRVSSRLSTRGASLIALLEGWVYVSIGQGVWCWSWQIYVRRAIDHDCLRLS